MAAKGRINKVTANLISASTFHISVNTTIISGESRKAAVRHKGAKTI